jgi:dolichol-phosphate mannosyltransferase
MQRAEAHAGRALPIDRWLRFGVVGLLNFLVDYGLFLLLFKLFGVQLLVANSVAVLVAASNSYLWNKLWTFQDPTRGRTAWRRYLLFLVFNLSGLVLANGVILVLIQLMTPELAKIGSIGVTAIWNYWTSRRFVYSG